MEFVTTAARSARASRLSLLAEAAPSCQELDGYEKRERKYRRGCEFW